MIARGGRSQALGEALQAQARQMFHWWHRVRDGTLAHPTFTWYMWPVRRAAERAIRPGVLWRQGSFGTQSPEGSRVVGAMMTVVATLKQQHRHVLDSVTAACEAALCGEPAPSLRPTLDTLTQVMLPAA